MNVPMYCPYCSQSIVPGAATCAHCGKTLPRLAAPTPTPGPELPVATAQRISDADRQRIAIEKAKVKEPILAAFLGLFLPSLGALYNGKVGIAVVFAILEIFAVLTGPLALVFHGVGCFLAYKWATAANLLELDRQSRQGMAPGRS